MRYSWCILAFCLAAHAFAETPGSGVWLEMKAKREMLPGLHQEFEVSNTLKTATKTQASKRQVILDMSQGQWRETAISGSGENIRIFDGKDLFSMEAGGDEYTRAKRHAKDPDPLPSVYDDRAADWTKAQEMQRMPCGFKERDHSCVILDAPIKRATATPASNGIGGGVQRVFIDTQTGMFVSAHTVKLIEPARGTSYESDTVFLLKRMSYGRPEEKAFVLPSGLTEVKELSRWDAPKIKKQLAGNPAPEMTATDILGKPVSLADYKGKTVLLDFWTTWCPPCRADAPALDKLYKKYSQDLMIVGVSVSEDRSIVEKFLKQHPHEFPVVLTTENEMPRPYQIGLFPTYIVIGKDGNLEAAAQGDQGFSELRKMLKKAGMEVE
jgi:thiol-disulfide isomerase/thioredoxin